MYYLFASLFRMPLWGSAGWAMTFGSHCCCKPARSLTFWQILIYRPDRSRPSVPRPMAA